MAHLGVVRESHEFLDKSLAAIVCRVRLAADHQLHGTLRMEQQLAQAIRITQHQGESLVRRHTPGEADREDVRVEDSVDPAELGITRTPHAPRGPQARSGIRHELLAQLSLDRPDGLVRDAADRLPAAPFLHEFGPDFARGEIAHLTCHPRGRVHPIGDGRDEHLIGIEARPQAGEHPPAHGAVQQAHAVGALRQPQTHHGHVEDTRVSVVERLRAQFEDALDRHPRLSIVTAEEALEELAGESIDSGRDRRVGREDRACAHRLERGVEVEPPDDQLAHALEPKEPRVAFIGVEDLRSRMTGDLAVATHSPDSTDAQEHLLGEAMLTAAAVETVGHIAVCRIVLLDVGIQEE